MFNLCFRYVENKDEAIMILNNGFLKIFKSYHKINANINPEPWIYKIMINEALKYIRDNHFKKNIKLGDYENIKIEAFEKSDSQLIAEDYYNIIRKLPLGYRTVFNLYAIEGYSHKEIANILSINESTSRSQLSKARGLLKKILAKSDLV